MNTLYNRLALTLPGNWIDHIDRDFAWNTQRLLDQAIDQYMEAVAACSLFQPFTLEELQSEQDFSNDQSRAYNSTLKSLYAKAYIYALDSTRAFVKVIGDQPGNLEQTKNVCNDLMQALGNIRDIRNSLQHIEERSQGFGSPGRKLPPGIILLSGFSERKFQITSGNGQIVEIEISEGFLLLVRSRLEEIVWSYDWLGPGVVPVQRPENREF